MPRVIFSSLCCFGLYRRPLRLLFFPLFRKYKCQFSTEIRMKNITPTVIFFLCADFRERNSVFFLKTENQFVCTQRVLADEKTQSPVTMAIGAVVSNRNFGCFVGSGKQFTIVNSCFELSLHKCFCLAVQLLNFSIREVADFEKQ